MAFVTLYLQSTLGLSPLQAAATLLPFSLAVIVGSSAAAVLLHHRQAQWVAALGLALIATSNGGYIAAGTSAWAFGVCAALGGAGNGLSSVATTGLGTSVEVRWRGTASGILNTAAQLGTAVGIAVLLLVATATTGTPASTAPAPHVAWLVAALVAAAGAAAFWSDHRSRRRGY
jgi:predicted MFS family arabinose efflux permease